MTTFEGLQNSLSQDALTEYRALAWKNLSLPIARKEPFKYMDLSKLWDMPLELHQPADLPIEENTIVFSNGHFTGSKLPAEVVVMPLSESLKTYGTFLQRRLQNEKDPFALLSRSFMGEGVFIYVPPKCVLKAPVRIVETNVGLACPQVFVRVGKYGALQILREGHHQFTTSYLDITLDEGAQLKLLQKGRGDWQFDAICASLQKNSTLIGYDLGEGQLRRCHIFAELLGEGASATFKGLSRLTKNQEAHQYLNVRHVAENTHSNQHFKTILKDAAKSSFEGKIYVEKSAQQTRAYQLNNNLLLGENAKAYSKPNLEIFADDVKASHGATMTRLNQDELFYLKSRGLSTLAAQSMLEKGFAQEILHETHDVFSC